MTAFVSDRDRTFRLTAADKAAARAAILDDQQGAVRDNGSL